MPVTTSSIIIAHFEETPQKTAKNIAAGHLGLEVADGLEQGCHFSPLLDSYLHADLVAGHTLYATLL